MQLTDCFQGPEDPMQTANQQHAACMTPAGFCEKLLQGANARHVFSVSTMRVARYSIRL